MTRALIDTDVILDFFFDRKPFSDQAGIIFSLCELKKLKGFVTPVICSNCYYLLRQTAQHNKVIQNLAQLLMVMDILTMDKEVVMRALQSNFKDFEDALQHFTAVKAANVDVIITRNVRDFAKSKLAVMTPEGFIKSLNLT